VPLIHQRLHYVVVEISEGGLRSDRGDETAERLPVDDPGTWPEVASLQKLLHTSPDGDECR
jgi:hypothetical protein